MLGRSRLDRAFWAAEFSRPHAARRGSKAFISLSYYAFFII